MIPASSIHSIVAGAALPVGESLPPLCAALREGVNAVLVAPPGAGKTTLVPLALLAEPWAAGKILLLSPRRIAARAAAARMAALLGEAVGETVGLRLRLDNRISARTRIEVLTEGVFTRLILADPALEGVSAVLFDEYHERSLEADLGLALALDAQAGLREDLRLLVMSATLQAGRVAALLGDAPVIESAGRLHPVALRYIGRDPRTPIEEQAAAAALRALASEPGSLLCFLPGVREIERAARRLEETAPAGVDVRPLYGAMAAEAQDAAIAPSPSGRRKVVLATSLAETSLTIEGVRVVIDSGLTRRPRFDPARGASVLETVRASRAAIAQRAGRAGRLEPGVCWRVWDEPETRSLPEADRPEILESDLSGLVLALAEWGVREAAALRWLDPPPAAAWKAARAELMALQALEPDGALSPHGARLARIPLPPRLAHMAALAAGRGLGGLAAELGVLLSEQGLGGRTVDLGARLAAWRADRSARAAAARNLARRIAQTLGAAPDGASEERCGEVLAVAFPERVAKARPSGGGAFLLANGRGAALAAGEALAREAFLVAVDVTGRAEESRIVAAAAIAEPVLERVCAERIAWRTQAGLDPGERRVRARRLRMLGEIVLADAPLERPGPEVLAAAWVQAVEREGLEVLPPAPEAAGLRSRIAWLGSQEPGGGWPDWSAPQLQAGASEWLGGDLALAIEQGRFDAAWREALLGELSWPQRRLLDDLAPESFRSPAGASHAIDYAAEGGPAVAVRLQELFGLAQHPCLLRGRAPLVLRLLSPAHRPVQTTTDLPGFWKGSYGEVRSALRGRYPKHAWPEDPLQEAPTLRAKPRR